MEKVIVNACWDPDAAVWVAESENLPGLAVECENFEALVAKLQKVIPELIALNNWNNGADDVPISLVSTCAFTARREAP